MNEKKVSGAQIVMGSAQKFLKEQLNKEKKKDQNATQVLFTRADIERHIDKELNVSQGVKTGALNRFLIEDGIENGVRRQGWGKYLYTTDEGLYAIATKIKQQLLNAFDDALTEVWNIRMPESITEEDLELLSKFNEIKKMRDDITRIL